MSGKGHSDESILDQVGSSSLKAIVKNPSLHNLGPCKQMYVI
jgi:hypothetical protein